MTFDFLETLFRDERFRGCIFVSAAGEHKDTANPVFRAAALHKRLTLAYFEELAHAARFAEPKRIAAEINLLHEGAIAVAQMTRTAEPARQAKRMAAQLLAVEGLCRRAVSPPCHQPGKRTRAIERKYPDYL